MTVKITNRKYWLDSAKGIGISLVVVYHTCEGILNSFSVETEYVLALTNFFRSWLMPMFFLVSGILISDSIQNSPSKKHVSKLLDWMYIYLVWSVIIYLVRLFSNSFTNTTMKVDEILFIIWNPVPTIWFIYALALSHLLTLLVKNQPPLIIISVALGANLLNSHYYGWFEGSILERFVWIYIFYAIGYYFKNSIIKIVQNEKLSFLGLGLFIFLGLVTAIYKSDIVGLVRPMVSIVMAISFLIICYSLERIFKNNMIFRLSCFLGGISLFVYLTHFPIPAASRMLLLKLDIYSFSLNLLLALTASIVVGTIGSRLARYDVFKFLFTRPAIKFNS